MPGGNASRTGHISQKASSIRKVKRFSAKSDSALYEIQVFQLTEAPGYLVEYRNLTTNVRKQMGSHDEPIATLPAVIELCVRTIRAEDSSVFSLLPLPLGEA